MNFYIKILFFLFFCNSAFAQFPTDIPLELRAQFNGQYDYVVIGNTLNEFDTFQTPPPPCQLLTQSSAQLNLNPNQNVVAAYLYWSGIGDGAVNPTIQLNSINLAAEELFIVDPEQTNFVSYFGAFKDITSIIQSSGNSVYTFSNLDLNPIISEYCSNGIYYAGWSIVVVYEDNSLPTQQVNIYDGLNSVFGFGFNFTSSITIDNLNVVDTQNARFSYLAWNGSPNLFFNESITFNGNVLSDALNPPDNPFNGTNTYTGATDLWSMDLDVFDISNFITLGDSQAEIVFSSVLLRLFQNVVTVIRSELPDAQVELVNFSGISDCDVRDFSIETVVSNPESSDILPANTPISFFVLDSNGDEVFLDTFFTQNAIPIDGSETQFLDISIPNNIPNDTTLIIKVNTLADGSNPVNENNILNNTYEQELNLLSSPEPIAVQDLSQCANLSDVLYNLEDAYTATPNPDETITFHLAQNEAENNVNPIADQQNYMPNNALETIFIRQSNADCFVVSSFMLETFALPQIIDPTPLSECDSTSDQSSFAGFDLASKIPEITNNNPDYDVQFFLTQAEAEDLTNTNSLTSPFTNTEAFSQILFVRVKDSNNGCVSFTTLDIEVNPLPAIAEASNIPDLELCDDNENGQAIFDLTLNNSIILNGLDPNLHQIQFYTSQTDAENEINSITSATNFTTSGQVIFVRVTETTTNCFAITSFNIVVNPVPQLQAVPTQSICDENADGFEVFDLSLAENSILPDTTGFSFQYFESLSDAQNEVNSISNPETYTNTQSPIQTVFVLVTDDLTGCENIQPFDIEVLENPQITDPTPLLECDTTSDQSGFAGFDLTSKIPEITNNNPEYEVNFFLTQAEAEDLTNTNSLTSPFTNTEAFSQILFVRVTDSNNGCVSFTTLELEIEAGADIFDETQLQNLRVCDEDDLTFFDLTQVESSIVDADNSNEFSINYFTSESDAIDNTNPIDQPDNFQNTEIPQNIWIRISVGGSCFEVASFQLDIVFLPVASSPENLFLCDAENDSIESFDLSQQNESILNGLSDNDNSISYHKTLADAESNADPIDVNYTNENNPQTIYARLENNNATDCFTITSFDIEVLETPSIDIDNELVICQDEPLIISIDDSYDEYLWSTGAASSTITVTEPGNYQVTALINHPTLSCEVSKSFEVILSEDATISNITTVDWTQSNNAITVLVEGNGDYEYSIDGINYQDSNVFNNLTEYEYLVSIRDKNGCGETLRRVYLLDYPRFFTPNGDGFNDRWQIINSRQEIFTKIYIFDRYGKLVADINPGGNGWDGIFNGNALPQNDYWFRVEREDGRVLTGHFTLKR